VECSFQAKSKLSKSTGGVIITLLLNSPFTMWPCSPNLSRAAVGAGMKSRRSAMTAIGIVTPNCPDHTPSRLTIQPATPPLPRTRSALEGGHQERHTRSFPGTTNERHYFLPPNHVPHLRRQGLIQALLPSQNSCLFYFAYVSMVLWAMVAIDSATSSQVYTFYL
jgi:hypothetical protein